MSEATAPADKKPVSRSPRRRAREFALQGVYQWLVAGADAAAIDGHMQEVSGFDKADRALFLSLLHGVLDGAPALDAQLAPLLDRGVGELSPVEHAVLLIAACEMQLHAETPYRVIINEAIELTKGYGGTDGHKYVNGVLDKLAPRVRPQEARAARSPRGDTQED
ncbi:MAG: transcription antitermination factor NusB [Rhodocyclaceae bacterium]|nr:transcription antitermination factor NusB [Rhodocyclaceae bacterium]MBX3668960.1 transcription antitermination factor NusB [Rhodocyclaceae bacterium]